MKVKATRLGYYGDKRQKPGAIFFLKETAHYSEKWMELISKEEKPRRRAAKKAVVTKAVDSDSEVI